MRTRLLRRHRKTDRRAGRWLMNRALEFSWSRPIARVWVHTCTFDHPAALAFYQRSGFRAFRRQIEVADDPRLDGTAPRDVARHVPYHRVSYSFSVMPSLTAFGKLRQADTWTPTSVTFNRGLAGRV
jgi:hypothetical protein